MHAHNPQIQGPLHPTRTEYPAFLRFLSRCYGFTDPRWFEKDASHFFGPTPSQLKTKWILKSGTKIVAHVGVFPFTALVDGRPLKVAGIGAVATDPRFRGKGLMKRLMDHVQQQIVKDGYDLSILWGERALYYPFGYERALYSDQFLFNKKDLLEFEPTNEIRAFRPSDSSAIKKLYSFRNPFQTRRTMDYIKIIQKKFKQTMDQPIWVYERKGHVDAYVVFGKTSVGGLELAEWGGPSGDVGSLMAHVIRKTSANSLTATIFPSAYLHHLGRMDNLDQTRTTRSCMLKIFNLEKVLKAFEPQLQRRYAAFGMNFQKSVFLETGDYEWAKTGTEIKTMWRPNAEKSVLLSLGKKLKVGGKSKKTTVITILSHNLTSFLFGLEKPSQLMPWIKNLGWLDALFPLEWYWWRSEWI